PAGIVSAVVTTQSVERLGLKVGDEALALFKATEVLVAKL
ncbi:MAG: TOBE domain-containing protein, partial [Pseudomonadota bacterium]|nr:TOBE domain-containing protein [Pseudomonadota bacterium]